MLDGLGVEARLAHVEVDDGDDVDGRELVVPLLTALGLLAYGEGGVVDGAVLHEGLGGVLHLDDEALAALVHAVYVEYGLALDGAVGEVLAVEVLEVGYDLLALEEGVEEVYEQVFVDLLAEDALEAEVREEAYVFFFCPHDDEMWLFGKYREKIWDFFERRVHRRVLDTPSALRGWG